MYLRGGIWWLRYTPAPGHPQARVSLNTSHAGQAGDRALERMAQPILDESAPFGVEMEAYIAESMRNEVMTQMTANGRRYAVKTFARECDVSKIAEITTANMERWAKLLRDRKQADATVRTYIMHLRAFCSWLVRKNKLRENPGKTMRLGKLVVRGRRNFVTKDKIRDLIAAAPDDDFRFILFCGFHVGMRKIEIIEARPCFFQLGTAERRGFVSIEKTATFRPKDKEERTIPLTAEFESFLRGYLAKLPEGAQWVLRPEKKKCHAATNYRVYFQRNFDDFVKSQGVRCSVHDMRRSFVSNKVIENSTLIFKLAKWTGTDVRTLQKHYGHLLADDQDIEIGM